MGQPPPTQPPQPQADAPGLFNEVIFCIIESDKLSKDEAKEIRKKLLDNGATEVEFRTNPNDKIPFDPAEVTHVIAADVDFPGQLEVDEAMKPIVTPAWVDTTIAKKRLAHVRPFTPDPQFFFSGVIATVAELPVGDKEAICGGIIAMGGQYNGNLTKFTTHLVALNMDNEKCKSVVTKKLPVKIVLPHWFDDCLKLNRRIDEQPYLLPNPEIERVDSTQPIPLPRGPDLTYAHANPSLSTQVPPSPRPNFNVFTGKRVLLGRDLGINPRLRNVISDIIKQARGEITENVLDAHVYVGQWREGPDYVTASRMGLYVGNLTWMYWMFAHGKWTSPLRRLLHYPLLKGGIPGFQKLIITVSSYGGDARLYLENLIEASGATFTKSMKAENTHLIAARAHSEKCTAAKEWNINMVNHLWLEESYAKCKVLTVADQKYTHFPTRTNLMEVVGQTPIDTRTIQQYYEPEDEDTTMGGMTSSDNPEEVPPNGQVKSTSMAGPPKNPVKAKKKTATVSAARPQFETPSNRGRGLLAQTPSSVTTTGSRRAKEQATARLHDLAPDIALYEKEKKRKGGVLGTGNRRWSTTPTLEAKSHKRAASEIDAELTADEEADTSIDGPGTGSKPKKAKKKVKPTIKLLITGYDGWQVPSREESDKRRLLDLGILCIAEPELCTYLAAPKIVRTRNFVCAIAAAPKIVNISWVKACLDENRIVEAEEYQLDDPEGETRLSINLAESLSRAEKLKGKLLDKYVLYCTPEVKGGFETCAQIIKANGGVCINFKTGKRGANIPEGKPEGGKLVLLSGEAGGDMKLWKPFVKMAKEVGAEPVIYRTDWLLDSAMRQKVVWDERYLVPQKK
ncbi:hypothetical protein BGX38DRAFT_1097298 [Terfezia claveryi]|nr:hypothetical protein BGX38DRAFT_1097298 [Terfezia claveryi]